MAKIGSLLLIIVEETGNHHAWTSQSHISNQDFPSWTFQMQSTCLNTQNWLEWWNKAREKESAWNNSELDMAGDNESCWYT